MKVLFLNPTGAIGGAERALLDLMASVAAARPDWGLELIAATDGDLVREAGAIGVPASVIPLPESVRTVGDAGAGGPAGDQVSVLRVAALLGLAAPAVISYLCRLRRAIGKADPTLIHTNGFKMHVLGARAMTRRSRLVWHLHDYVQPRPIMSRLLRWHVRRCRAVIANSKSVAADARVVLGSTTPIFPVYNAIDLARFTPVGPQLDLDELSGLEPLGEGGVRVGLVATFARWKGHTTFLRALAALPLDSRVRGYVVGSPLYQTHGSQHSLEELRALAAALGLNGRIGFTGFVARAPAVFRSLDIVVHASTAPEPFGLVIAEAMACGRAVVASTCGGAAELFSDGVDALGHRPGDPADLAEQIMRLVRDRDLRVRLGENAAAVAARHFTRSRLATELIPIYSNVAAGRGT
jgi:glycosyltransferase involved in cell wall biosynthesis